MGYDEQGGEATFFDGGEEQDHFLIEEEEPDEEPDENTYTERMSDSLQLKSDRTPLLSSPHEDEQWIARAAKTDDGNGATFDGIVFCDESEHAQLFFTSEEAISIMLYVQTHLASLIDECSAAFVKKGYKLLFQSISHQQPQQHEARPSERMHIFLLSRCSLRELSGFADELTDLLASMQPTGEVPARVVISGITAKTHTGYLVLECASPIPGTFFRRLTQDPDILNIATYDPDGLPKQRKHP